MKLKHLIGTFVLAGVLAIGATAFATNDFSKEEIKSADAATTFTSGSSLFFRSSAGWWYDKSAVTWAYFFNNSNNSNYWSKMNYNYFTDNFCFCSVPDGSWPNVIFVRKDPNCDYAGWDGKWNQTADLDAESNKDCYVYDGSSGSWSSFSTQQSWQIGVGSTMTSLSYRNNSEGAVFYSTSVNLVKDSTLYGHRNAGSGNEGWFKSQYFEEGAASGVGKGYIKKNGTDVDATVLKAGTLEFYVKMNSQLIWSQVPSSTEADSYAQEFLTTITCNGSSVTSALSAWNTVGTATTSMEYKFSQLTAGAKNILKAVPAGGNKSGTNVEKCIARYDFILGKYGYGTGTDKYHDFMERTPAKQSAVLSVFTGINEERTTPIIAVVIVTVVSLTAIGGYFYLRHKKEQ